ncbi:MAG: ABC transporter ATP-binding protein [Holosporales bacterium]|nr:ABC transporter ATP-binding protein [Holosporales bacterium]
MILELRNIVMQFKSGDSCIKVLDGINFSMKNGESVALVGQSGTGKSTLLQIVALLEKPTSGAIIINGEDATNLSDDGKTEIRRQTLGFVYQFHNLLPEFSAIENIMIPQLVKKVTKKEARKRALELLTAVNLSHRANHNPKNLSGGEQQRVAIARALANRPKLIIADEPTGNLDPYNAEVIFDIFVNLVKSNSTSLLMATHNLELAKKLGRTVYLSEGKIF